MRFKMIFLIFALAMFMLAGAAWAKDDDDQCEDDSIIRQLQADVAALQDQIEALTVQLMPYNIKLQIWVVPTNFSTQS